MKYILTAVTLAVLLTACGSEASTPEVQPATSSTNTGTDEPDATPGSPAIRNTDTSREEPPLDLGTIAFSVGDKHMNFENLDRNSTELKLRDDFATLLYQEKDSQRKMMVAFRNVDTRGNLAGTYTVGGSSREEAQATVTALNILASNEHVTMATGTVTVEAIEASGVCKVKWEGEGFAIKDVAQKNPFPMEGDVSMVFHSVKDLRTQK